MPASKLKHLIRHVQITDPASLSVTDLEEKLGFTPSEALRIIDSVGPTHDGKLLATSLELALKLNSIKRSRSIRLVVSGNFYKSKADYTHETVYQMINRAKHSIMIVGYWMYDIQDLLGEISTLQEERGLRITFIMNSAKRWRRQILRVWNKKYKPDILEPSADHVKTLHAKIIIVDRSEILVTSANMTINAMEKNIEAGIWTSDRDIVNSCRAVFSEFEENGTIIPVTR